MQNRYMSISQKSGASAILVDSGKWGHVHLFSELPSGTPEDFLFFFSLRNLPV